MKPATRKNLSARLLLTAAVFAGLILVGGNQIAAASLAWDFSQSQRTNDASSPLSTDDSSANRSTQAASESTNSLSRCPIASLTALATTNRMFKLRGNVIVDGEGVFLNQLFDPSDELPRLRLCDPPVFGKALLLKGTDVATLAGAAGFPGMFTNWTAADRARISRRSRTFAEKEVLELLTSSLQQQYVKEVGQLELRFCRPWTPANIPDEAFTIQVTDLPTSGVSPNFIARFEIQTVYGEHVGSWQAAVRAKVWREVWITRSAVKRGDLVRAADLARERRDMLLFHEPLVEFSPEDAPLEFLEPLQPGSPLLARLVKPRSIVHRGQSIAAVVRDGAMMITLKVEALEDGAAGQLIRVRNPLSRRDLHAKVLDEQNVLVCL